MKKLFLTLAIVLVGTFAFAKNEKVAKTNKAENATSDCIAWVYSLEDYYGIEYDYDVFNALVLSCESRTKYYGL